MKSLSDQKKGSLMAFVAVMFITPDSLFIRLSNVETWSLVFYRGIIPFVLVFVGMLLIYRLKFFNLLRSKSNETFVIEAGSTMYWNKYTKYENIFGLDNFGASAPGNEVFRKFGLTTETVSSKIIRKIRTK